MQQSPSIDGLCYMSLNFAKPVRFLKYIGYVNILVEEIFYEKIRNAWIDDCSCFGLQYCAEK